MDFLDDESRPRFLFQSRSSSAAASSPATDSPATGLHNKPLLIACVSLSLLFIAASIFLLQSDLLRSLSLWISISLILGPFAPPSITAGDIRVGRGDVVDFPSPQEDPAPVEESKRRRPKSKRSEELGFGLSSNSIRNPEQTSDRSGDLRSEKEKESDLVKEKEWTDEDMELLRKQIVKNPVGKPRRWEVIADAFKGRHGVQSVIKTAKSMGDAKPEDSDSYSKFLRNRKPVDKRVDDQISAGEVIDGAVWSSGEDIALLNAVKAFPKDVAMRWERIALAVPGKSKAECVKRLADLKKDFRSSKANVAADS